MKHNGRSLLLGFLLFALSAPLAAAEWKSADNPDDPMRERLVNKDYSVSVRRAGAWKALPVYGALVSNLDLRDQNWLDYDGKERSVMGFSLFTDEFKQPVRVRVTRKGAPFREVAIRPLSYGIEPKVVGPNTIEFELQSPQQKVSVEFDGDRQCNLFVLPDLPDPNNPKRSSADVYYFGPGEHHLNNLLLKSGQTLYIDEGAIVYAHLGAYNAENITVAGRGILCGSANDHSRERRQVLINFEGCRNIDFSGVLLRDSPNWTFRMLNCTDIHIDNMKQICWMLNSDGVDFCNCRNALMENCFMRNYDDNVSIKTFSFGGPISENLTVRNCVFWADAAHNFLVGPEADSTKTIRNFQFLNSIVLESREWLDPYTGAIGVMISDEGNYSDVRVENIIVEDIRGGKVFSFDFGIYNGPGQSARNILVRNVRYDGFQAAKSVLRGYDELRTIDGVRLENILYNGTLITADNYTDYFETNPFVRNLQFGR